MQNSIRGGVHVETTVAVKFCLRALAHGIAIRARVVKPSSVSIALGRSFLGFGIATFSFWRLMSRAGAALADFLVMALGLTTLLNPILYNYYNVKIAAWNNLAVGFVVLILAFYQDWKDSESSR